MPFMHQSGTQISVSDEVTRVVSHLAEFREVVLQAQAALPQSCGAVTDALWVALPLGPPVSHASYYTGDQLPWEGKKKRNGENPVSGYSSRLLQ